MAFKLGFNAKLYRQTSGTRAAWPGTGAAPNLDEVPNVRDLKLSEDTAVADVSTRGGGGYTQEVAALKHVGATWQMVYDPSDADFTAIQTAYRTNAVIALAILDGTAATVGTQGMWFDAMITKFEMTQELTNAIVVDVEVVNAYSAVAPAWVTTA